MVLETIKKTNHITQGWIGYFDIGFIMIMGEGELNDESVEGNIEEKVLKA